MKKKTTAIPSTTTDESTEDSIPCFLCGVCCSKYHVQVGFIEARRIADDLGVTWEEWLDKYVEPSWPGTQSFLLRRVDGICIFLDRMPDRSLCRIHSFKPSSCVDWTASLFRRECKEGLLKCWGMTVSPSGHLLGTEQKLREFHNFLETIQ
ncbi:MAG: YkgJ family cysteine cluster protein, partial [Chloroflexi bacterium]|nr:YkgJ family cysteine cluster protein [Chloroflexota bacterium]